MVRGSGSAPNHRRRCRSGVLVRPDNAVVRSWWVRCGRWPDRPTPVTPLGAYAPRVAARHHIDMHLPTTAVRPPERPDSVMGGTLVGGLLVFGGLWLAYVAWSTPILVRHRGGDPSRRGSVGSRDPGLRCRVRDARARSSSSARTGSPGRSPRSERSVARSWRSTLADPARRRRALAGPDPRRRPTRADAPRRRVRSRRGARDARSSTEDDLVVAMRDAERVRHWLNQNDQDFVVRVHAAVVGPPTTIARTPGLRAHHGRAGSGVARVAAPSAQPERRSAGSTREAGQAARLTRSTRVWLVGEPGLEPGTSGI